MGLPVTYVWTHDSIGLGEDGPTHQPIEHLAALRAIPGPRRRPPGRRQRDRRLLAGRPRAHRPPGRPRPDPAERAGLPARRGRASATPATSHRAATCCSTPTGGAARRRPRRHRLRGPARRRRPASCWPRRASAPASSRCRAGSGSTRRTRPTARPSSRRPSRPGSRVEAGVAQGWREVVGDHGRIVSIEHYGASADFARIYREFGVTAEAVAAAAEDSIRVATG